MEPWVFYTYEAYLHWLRYLLERLGRETTLRLWRNAFKRSDGTEQLQILNGDWVTDEESGAQSEESKLQELVARYFPEPVEGLAPREAAQLIEQTPPMPVLRNRLSVLSVKRQATAYEALLLFFEGFALLAESIISELGKKGEFLIYSIRLSEPNMCRQQHLTVEEYMKRRVSEFRTDRPTPNVLSAGLDILQISSSDREVVQHVTQCEWARYYRFRHPTVGYLLCCSTDSAAYRRANDSIRLQRTSTLMEGGKLCDFRIYAVEEPESEPVGVSDSAADSEA
jgi:hypothetical protein